MRLSSILLLIHVSSTLFACRIAATASELASVTFTSRDNSVHDTISSNKMRGTVHAIANEREEERSPLTEQVALKKLRELIPNDKLPLLSVPVDDMPERFPPAYIRELLFLDQELKKIFVTKEDLQTLENLLTNSDLRDNGEIVHILAHLYNLMELKGSWGENYRKTLEFYLEPKNLQDPHNPLHPSYKGDDQENDLIPEWLMNSENHKSPENHLRK